MAFINLSDFSMGEVSPKYQYKKGVLGSGQALKQAVNVVFDSTGSVSKMPGFEVMKLLAEGEIVLNSFTFSFNRYQSYFCIIIASSEQGLTKLRIFDNAGNVIGSDINLPYNSVDAREINYFQANDVMWFYHSNYDIMLLKRLSENNFSFDTYGESSFYNIVQQNNALIVSYDDTSKGWFIYAQNPIFDDSYLNKSVIIKRRCDGTTLNALSTTADYQNIFFANSFAMDFTSATDYNIQIFASSDGENYSIFYNKNFTANQSSVLTWADDGKCYFFKIQITSAGTLTLIAPEFFYFQKATITSIVNAFKAAVTVENDTPAFRDMFLYAMENLSDVILNDTNYGTPSYAKRVFNTSYVDELNYNILGLSASTDAQCLFGESFVVGSTDSPTFKWRYDFKPAGGIFLDSLLIKGQFRFGLNLNYSYSLSSSFIVQLVYTDDSVRTIHAAYNTGGYNQVIDINVNNLNASNVKAIQIVYVLQSFRITSGTPPAIVKGYPNYFRFYAIKGYGRLNNDAQSTSDKVSSLYSFYDQNEKATTGCLFQNRHFIANTSMIASAIGAYNNFSNLLQNQISDDAPFIVVQNTFKYGRILQIVPFKQGIMALTTDQEIFYYAEGALTPSSRNQVIVGERGNENITPLILERGFVGVERGGDFYFQGFDFASQSYLRQSLKQFAEHLFYGKTIQKIDGLMSSDKTIIILFTDGTIVRLYFDINAGILAFSRVIVEGDILTLSVIDNNEKKELWAVIDDKIVKFNNIDERYPNFLHFAQKFTGVAEGQVLTLPEYFKEGDKVYALCYDDKGFWCEPHTLDDTLKITLQKECAVAFVGFAYKSTIQTCDIGGGDDNFYAQKDRPPSVILGLVDTLGLKVNNNNVKFDSLESDYPKPFTGKEDVKTFGRHSREKTVTITSELPYPFTITAIDVQVAEQ